MIKLKYLIGILIIVSLIKVSQLKRNKKYDENEDKNEQDKDEDNEKPSPRNRDYKGKDVFGPIVGYGPFKIDKGAVADRSYDVGFILGQGYGFKLSKGIKKGIKQSLMPGSFKKKDGKEEEEDKDD